MVDIEYMTTSTLLDLEISSWGCMYAQFTSLHSQAPYVIGSGSDLTQSQNHLANSSSKGLSQCELLFRLFDNWFGDLLVRENFVGLGAAGRSSLHHEFGSISSGLGERDIIELID